MKTGRLKYLLDLPKNVVYQTISSPVGELAIFCSCDELFSILWEHEIKSEFGKSIISLFSPNQNNILIHKVHAQMMEYFDGKRKRFSLPISLKGTDFQKKSWEALRLIPYGSTISYKDQAVSIGSAKAVRAVGTANGLNPISIIIPCHRVVGSNGHLTGFGGGLENKKFLIDLEASND